MIIRESITGNTLRRVLAVINPGEVNAFVEEAPDEVRLFSPTSPNGDPISWTFDTENNLVALAEPVPAGSTAVVISSGYYLFETLFMLDNGDIPFIKSGIIIREDDYNLKNIRVDVAGPNYTLPTIKWLDDAENEHDFPYMLDFQQAGVPIYIPIKVYYSGENFGNYRDVWLYIYAERCGTNA